MINICIRLYIGADYSLTHFGILVCEVIRPECSMIGLRDIVYMLPQAVQAAGILSSSKSWPCNNDHDATQNELYQIFILIEGPTAMVTALHTATYI